MTLSLKFYIFCLTSLTTKAKYCGYVQTGMDPERLTKGGEHRPSVTVRVITEQTLRLGGGNGVGNGFNGEYKWFAYG